MSAPRVTVQAHIPWYWRALVTLMLIVVAVLLATWVYDIGRRFAGFDKTVADHELQELHNKVESLEAEVLQLRNVGTGSEASLQIDQTMLQKLGEQIKRLEIDNGRLREELAVFEKLFSDESKSEPVRISRLQVEADPMAAGSFRYRLLITAPASHSERAFRGKLQLIAVTLKNGKSETLNVADGPQFDARKLQVDFKYFQRVEGSFILAPQSELKQFEARLMQGAVVVATQRVTL